MLNRLSSVLSVSVCCRVVSALLLLHLVFLLVERASHDTSDPVYDTRPSRPPSSSVGQMGAVSLEKAARRAVGTRDAATFSVFVAVAVAQPRYRDRLKRWSVVKRNLPLLLLHCSARPRLAVA